MSETKNITGNREERKRGDSGRRGPVLVMVAKVQSEGSAKLAVGGTDLCNPVDLLYKTIRHNQCRQKATALNASGVARRHPVTVRPMWDCVPTMYR